MTAARKMLVLLVVAFAALSLFGCGPGQLFGPTLTPTPTFTPTFTPTPLPTSTPTITPTPTFTPTFTPSPTPQGGSLTVKLTGEESKKPVAGAAVILCLANETNCTIQEDLMALTGADGAVQFSGIPFGKYIIFYILDGMPQSSLAGLSVDVNDNTAACVMASVSKKAAPECANAVPFYKDGGLMLKGNATLTFGTTGMLLSKGTLFSEKYSLYLEILDSKVSTALIEPDQNSTIEIIVGVK